MTSKFTRTLAVASVAALLSTMAMDADARPGRGRSAGDRGSRSDMSVPSTPTAPRTTTPATAGPSATTPNVARPQAAPQPGSMRPPVTAGSRMGTIATGFAAGLLGAGLFGMLSGSGFFSGLGSFAGAMGFLLQLALIFFAVKLVMSLLRKRQAEQPVPASVPAHRMERATAVMGHATVHPSAGHPASASQPSVAMERPRHDAVGIGGDDYKAFEQSLVGIMAAYSAHDVPALRRLTSPTVSAGFEQELAEAAQQDIVNVLGQPTLLQGDLAESWFEEQAAFATVAMRYSMTDVVRRRSTGEIVSGHAEHLQEVTEIWTFCRDGAGRPWLLCGIEQA
jgi:predicted lipid-binding transport protein (Tim44 family)